MPLPPRLQQLLRALFRNALILGVCFVLLEAGTRFWLPDGGEPPRAVRDVDPAKRIAFRPQIESVYETDEFRFTVRTNRFGMRDVEWPAAVIADPRNLLFVGDSMVFGYGVEHEWTVPTLLEARLAAAGRPREVLNFSMIGSLPTYADLIDEALRIGVAAETILLGVTVGNDFSENTLRRSAEQPAGDGARRAPPPWYRRSAFLDYLRRRAVGSPLVVGSTLTIGRWLGLSLYDTSGSYVFLRTQTPEQEALFRNILAVSERIVATAREHGRHLQVVIFPNKIQVENAGELTGAIYDARKPNRLIQEQCDALGVPCLDLLPVLTEAYEGGSGLLFFPMDRHHNPKGNEIVAEAIFRFLSRGGSDEAPPGV